MRNTGNTKRKVPAILVTTIIIIIIFSQLLSRHIQMTTFFKTLQTFRSFIYFSVIHDSFSHTFTIIIIIHTAVKLEVLRESLKLYNMLDKYNLNMMSWLIDLFHPFTSKCVNRLYIAKSLRSQPECSNYTLSNIMICFDKKKKVIWYLIKMIYFDDIEWYKKHHVFDMGKTPVPQIWRPQPQPVDQKDMKNLWWMMRQGSTVPEKKNKITTKYSIFLLFIIRISSKCLGIEIIITINSKE